MSTFADRVIEFNNSLAFTGKLPDGIRIMNPFKNNDSIITISSAFYKKYYNDNNRRHLILGINPGRFGAGITGIPFTDTKHLKNECGINYSGIETHEPSSVFVYEVIEKYGGIKKFYNDFFINSICPLGFTISDSQGKETNYNYYDCKELTDSVYDFMISSIRKIINIGIHTDVCFCFGTGKNYKFFQQLNHEKKYFNKIIAIEHPRYVMQYKTKSKSIYMEKYLAAFNQIQK